MTNEEYQVAIQQIMAFTAAVRRIDAKGVVERLERADSAGAVLDPTAYPLPRTAVTCIEEIIRERDAAVAAREADREIVEAALIHVACSMHGVDKAWSQQELALMRAVDKHRAAAGEEK